MWTSTRWPRSGLSCARLAHLIADLADRIDHLENDDTDD